MTNNDRWVDPKMRLPKNEYRLFAVMPNAVGTITCELNRSGIIESLAAHPEQTFKWLDNEGDPQADKEGYERAIYALRGWVKDLQKKIEQAEPIQQVGLRWIPVSERMPEVGSLVLLFSEYMHRGKPATEMFVGYLGEQGECFKHDDDDYGWAFEECITYWAELPASPLECVPEQPLLSVQQQSEDDLIPDLSSLPDVDKQKFFEGFLQTTGKAFLKVFYMLGLEWGFETGIINEGTPDKFRLSFKKEQPSPSIEIEQKAPTRSPSDGAASFHPDSHLMRGPNDKRHLTDANGGDIQQENFFCHHEFGGGDRCKTLCSNCSGDLRQPKSEPLPLGQQETKFYCTRKYCSPCKEQCSGCAEEFKSLGQQEGEVPEDSPSDEEVIKTLIEANAGLQEHIDHMEGKLAEKMDFIDELQSERKADADRIAALEKERDDYRNALHVLESSTTGYQASNMRALNAAIKETLSQYPHPQSKKQ